MQGRRKAAPDLWVAYGLRLRLRVGLGLGGSLLALLMILVSAMIPPAAAFTRVGSLTLKPSEDGLFSALLDSAAGFAYFGTNTSPGNVTKVRLSDFTRVGSLTLKTGENQLLSAVIDAAHGFAYFGTYTSPGMIVKIRLSDFTEVGSITLNTGEQLLRSAVIDSTHGFAYFGTSPGTGRVVKVRLSDFTRFDSLTLNPGEENLTSAVIDVGGGFAYFGTGKFGSTGRVVKIRLSDFREVGSLTLKAGENQLFSAVIDAADGYAYFGTYTSPGMIVKIRLSDFREVDSLTLNSYEDFLSAAVIDTTGINAADRFAYFGTYTSPGRVLKIHLSDFSEVGNLTLSASAHEENLGSAVIDAKHGFTYFDTITSPGIVVKVQVAAPPSSPTGLAATPGRGQISLNWNPPSSSGDRALTGYRVYRGYVQGGETSLRNLSSLIPNYVDNITSLPPGKTYYYEVKAVNSFGESGFSNEASAAPDRKPSGPQNLHWTGIESGISLSWRAPSWNGGSSITNYTVYRANSTEHEVQQWPLLLELGNVTSYNDTSLIYAKTYYYEVKAVNSLGEGSSSNEVSTAPVYTLPVLPVLLTTTLAILLGKRYSRVWLRRGK